MNVRELIEELKTFDEDLEVKFLDSEWGNCSVNRIQFDDFKWIPQERRPNVPVVLLQE